MNQSRKSSFAVMSFLCFFSNKQFLTDSLIEPSQLLSRSIFWSSAGVIVPMHKGLKRTVRTVCADWLISLFKNRFTRYNLKGLIVTFFSYL